MKNCKLKIGLIQMHCGKNPQENLAKAILRIKKLAKAGAKIICLPELFLTEYFCQSRNPEFFKLAEKIPDGHSTRVLQSVAKAKKVVIIASIYEKASSKFFNTAVAIDSDGKFLGKYRKMHIPDDPQHYYDEAHYFSEGDLGVKVFKTKYTTIAVLICWDQWFPESAREAAKAGAEIIFYPTAIGFQPKERLGIKKAEHEAWQLIQRSHAIANNVFVAAANHVKKENNLNFWGSSFVSDPYGRVISQAPADREADLLAECDLSLIPQMRRDWPFLENC
ncbi:carbon-nitrogen hydrolase [Candidatus Peregrinibacteria bacterium]|nr:carbon-nitrogen hydrolase [Candidatus Peregrinibacteria bacterium]